MKTNNLYAEDLQDLLDDFFPNAFEVSSQDGRLKIKSSLLVDEDGQLIENEDEDLDEIDEDDALINLSFPKPNFVDCDLDD